MTRLNPERERTAGVGHYKYTPETLVVRGDCCSRSLQHKQARLEHHPSSSRDLDGERTCTQHKCRNQTRQHNKQSKSLGMQVMTDTAATFCKLRSLTAWQTPCIALHCAADAKVRQGSCSKGKRRWLLCSRLQLNGC